MILKEILSGIADLVFPPRCVTCGVLLEKRTPLPFCPACAGGIRLIRSPLCSRCGLPFLEPEGEDHPCGECLAAERPYAVARAVGYYEETLLRAIHLFKYRGKTGIGEVLGKMMADFAGGRWEMGAFDRILPVPLHPKRLRERGFNQSVILACEISKRFAVPLDPRSLERRVPTAPQVGLGREERSANVRGAFAVGSPERIDGKRILLVDDVFTTGSTLGECSAVLLRAGAEGIAVLTMARAVRSLDSPAAGEIGTFSTG